VGKAAAYAFDIHLVHDANYGVVYRHELLRQGQRRLTAGDDEHQLAGAGLGGAIRGDDGLAIGLLVPVQRLDDEKFDSLKALAFARGYQGTNNASKLHEQLLT